MNLTELKLFSEQEKLLPDAASLPASYLLKCLLLKLVRKIFPDPKARLVWTVSAISDVHDHTATIRNYLDQKTIRAILKELTQESRIDRACEVGCGYGRVIMVLKEFANYVTGFERENHLVKIARSLQPDIEFQCINSLLEIEGKEPYDFVMTCTVLQHLNDQEARQVCSVLQKLAPKGHILLIEKTEPFNITENIEDGTRFISRDRSVKIYCEYMLPYNLVMTHPRVIEPTYSNPKPGTCMLFASPNI
jgi:SAM-dependent methyltransferase